MPYHKLILICLLIVIPFSLSACGGKVDSVVDQVSPQELAETQAISTLLAADGLKVVGLVDFPTVWTGEQLRAMELIDVTFLNSSGAETAYQGVPIIFLLSLVGVQDQASKLIIKNENGLETEVMLVDINACINCIAAPIDLNNFSVILPGIQTEGVQTKVVQFVLK